MAAEAIREHDITLAGTQICLRPMRETDWDILYRWNNDPEVLYWIEGDNISSRSMVDVQRIYRGMSQKAFMFIGEYEGRAVAECWLQEMNMPEPLAQYPDADLRRIDLGIGEKELWGRGLGTQIIALLTRFGFAVEKADKIYGLGIRDDNVRSLGSFAKNGYGPVAKREREPGAKSRYEIDMVIGRAEWLEKERAEDAS